MSHFVKEHPFRVDRIQPSMATVKPTFQSKLATQPGRFLMTPELWTSPDHRMPPIPDGICQSAPINRSFFIGRLDEPPPDCEVIPVTLWEWPSARELWSQLPADALDPCPRPGTRIRVWTWIELPGKGDVIPRLYVEVDQTA